LEKPFRPRALLEAVAARLDGFDRPVVQGVRQ